MLWARIISMGLLAIMAAACGKETPAPTESKTVTVTTTASPSPSPSPELTLESVIQQFTTDLRAESYPFEYALLDEESDFKSGGKYAPMILLVWKNTPKSFNQYEAIGTVLAAGASDDLQAVGVRSYGTGVILKSQDTVFVFTVRLRDAELVPGADADMYVGSALPATIPEFQSVE
jgi:hypothetical protein